MNVRRSVRHSATALATAAIITAGLVVASPAQAGSSAVIWRGPYMSMSRCRTMQAAYSHGTTIVYPCYAMTQTAYVFGYVIR